MTEIAAHELKGYIETLAVIKSALAKDSSKLINLTVSGAHLYGFESKDSDIDYRGSFLAKTNRLLGLNRIRDTLEIADKENDIVLFELGKEVRLALAGNCNVLEHINAPQLFTTREYIKLKELINGAFGKEGIYNSYKGMATFNYKKFILNGRSTCKKYLYIFRGLMAGIYALRTGQIEPNIRNLNRTFKIPEVKELIEAKSQGTENELSSIDNGKLDKIIANLFTKIDDAYAKSKLPEKPDEDIVAKVNDFLVGLRKGYID